MRSLCLTACLLTIPFWACKDQTASTADAEAAQAAAAQPERAYVTAITGLKRQPNEEKKIDEGGKKVSNWLATLYRGEEFTVTKVEGDYAFGKASDDTEGWLKKDTLLPTEGVTLATVLEEAKTFSRPDLLALNAQRKIEPGALLFVLKNKDQFVEVNFYGKSTAWVLAEKLATDSTEVAAAKLLNKIRWLKEKNDPTANEMLELARGQYGSTRVMGMLEEAPAPAGEAAEVEESGD